MPRGRPLGSRNKKSPFTDHLVLGPIASDYVLNLLTKQHLNGEKHNEQRCPYCNPAQMENYYGGNASRESLSKPKRNFI